MSLKKPGVNKASEEARNAIRRASAYSLPNNPKERGMKVEDIKKAFWEPIVGLTNSVILEQDRIVDEINQYLTAFFEHIGSGDPEKIGERYQEWLKNDESGLTSVANVAWRVLVNHLDQMVDGAVLANDKDPHHAQKHIRESIQTHDQNKESHGDLRKSVWANGEAIEMIRARYTGEGRCFAVNSWQLLRDNLSIPDARIFKLEGKGDDSVMLGWRDLVTGDMIYTLNANTPDFFFVSAARAPRDVVAEEFMNTSLVVQGNSGGPIGYLFIDGISLMSLQDGEGPNSVQQEGCYSSGAYAFSTGFGAQASGYGSRASGYYTIASGGYSWAGGFQSTASGYRSFSWGYQCQATEENAWASGSCCSATGGTSHAEGTWTLASQSSTHAEGRYTIASGWASHAGGDGCESYGIRSYADGFYTLAAGKNSRAHGEYTVATEVNAIAEGHYTEASHYNAKAWGAHTIASAKDSSASGYWTQAISAQSTATGAHSVAGTRFYYISSIDFNAKRIQLSGLQTKPELVSGIDSGLTFIEPELCQRVIGKEIYIDNGNHYAGMAIVKEVTDNGILTYEGDLGFTSIAKPTNSLDDWTLRIPEVPEFGIRVVLEDSRYGSQFAEGIGCMATGVAAHAEGIECIAGGNHGHAEGKATKAGYAAHSEGQGTLAWGIACHAEGSGCSAGPLASEIANGTAGANMVKEASYYVGAHAEGYWTTANARGAHSEGDHTVASAHGAHAEGYYTKAVASYAHTEGHKARATGIACHAEGRDTAAGPTDEEIQDGTAVANLAKDAAYYTCHAEGVSTVAVQKGAHAEGGWTKALYPYSHAEGQETTASAKSSHVEGYKTSTHALYGHAEGRETSVLEKAEAGHAEGYLTQVTQKYGHAEGQSTAADGLNSHAEGCSTVAGNTNAHAEGNRCKALYYNCHAEGQDAVAEGHSSHAEGISTGASGRAAHAEGEGCKALGDRSHASGYCTIAKEACQFVCGQYNADNYRALFMIGAGTSDSNRLNAFEVFDDGGIWSLKLGNAILTESAISSGIGGSGGVAYSFENNDFNVSNGNVVSIKRASEISENENGFVSGAQLYAALNEILTALKEI